MSRELLDITRSTSPMTLRADTNSKRPSSDRYVHGASFLLRNHSIINWAIVA